MQPQNRPPRCNSQQRTQRTQRPAPETRDAQIHQEQSEKARAHHKARPVVRLVDNVILFAGRRRQNRHTRRSHKQAEGIDPTDNVATPKCRNQSGDQQEILRRVPRFVAIGRNPYLAPLGL